MKERDTGMHTLFIIWDLVLHLNLDGLTCEKIPSPYGNQRNEMIGT